MVPSVGGRVRSPCRCPVSSEESCPLGQGPSLSSLSSGTVAFRRVIESSKAPNVETFSIFIWLFG